MGNIAEKYAKHKLTETLKDAITFEKAKKAMGIDPKIFRTYLSKQDVIELSNTLGIKVSDGWLVLRGRLRNPKFILLAYKRSLEVQALLRTLL